MNVYLKPQRLNILLSDKGNLFLPESSDETLWLQILFTEKENFSIFGGEKEIFLGMHHAKSVITNPGEGIFDTQPQFIYVPEKQAWFCLTQGHLIFPEIECFATF